MLKFIYKYAVTLCISWTAIIFILCATPGQYIPSASWLELLSFDKLVHATLFFIFASLLFITAIKYQRTKIFVLACFLLSVCYGGLLEWMQATCFSNRSADWKDMAANTFGCIMALLFFKKLKALNPRKII
jgi:hypothetical protein